MRYRWILSLWGQNLQTTYSTWSNVRPLATSAVPGVTRRAPPHRAAVGGAGPDGRARRGETGPRRVGSSSRTSPVPRSSGPAGSGRPPSAVGIAAGCSVTRPRCV